MYAYAYAAAAGPPRADCNGVFHYHSLLASKRVLEASYCAGLKVIICRGFVQMFTFISSVVPQCNLSTNYIRYTETIEIHSEADGNRFYRFRGLDLEERSRFLFYRYLKAK